MANDMIVMRWLHLLVCFILIASILANDGEIGVKELAEKSMFKESTTKRYVFDDNTLYKISFNDAEGESNRTELEPNVDNEKPSNEEIIFTNLKQEHYQCSIPIINNDEDSQAAKKNQIHENPYKLLKPLFNHKICSFRIENYWTYEVCHGKYLRQFHEEPGGRSVSQEYILGNFDMESYADLEKYYEEHLRGKKLPHVNVDDLSLPYIEVNMTDGTSCDLSNRKRSTRVLYVCVESGKHELYSITEIATCEYEIISFSPLLCDSAEFKVKTAEENLISCRPLGNAPTIPNGYQLKGAKKGLNNKKSSKNKLLSDGFLTLTKDRILIDTSVTGGIVQLHSDNNKNTMPTDGVEEIIETYSNPLMVKQFLSGEHCLSGGSGWWKYEFCYKKSVSQYHEEKKSKLISIKLGEWNLDEHIKWLQEHPTKRVKIDKTPKQVSHYYSNGDLCEATNKPRSVEVKLRCPNTKTSPDSVALYLLEPKTCEYVLGIETPIICDLLSTVDENGLFQTLEDSAAS